MYVSESTFLHLSQAEDERKSREREYRRIAEERAAETGPASGRRLSDLFRRLRHSEPVRRHRLSHP